MSEMIERVARVLCPERDEPDPSMNGRITGDDGRCYPPGLPRWHEWEEQAREVIAAMRSPTEEMLYPTESGLGIRSRRHASRIWGKMIDEALR